MNEHFYLQLAWGVMKFKDGSIAKRPSDVMPQTNKPVWRTIAFFKRVSLQYSKTTFLKRKLYITSISIIFTFPLFLLEHAYVV